MRFWGIRLVSVLAALGFAYLVGTGTLNPDGSAGFLSRLVALAGLYVTLAVSLNLINGITGQFSIGHAGFYMVGAYAGGLLTSTLYQNFRIGEANWLLLAVPAGALAAGLAGLVVGLPSLRLRGDYLAIVTLGFGEIIRIVVQSREEFGGSYGLQIVPMSPELWNPSAGLIPTYIWALAILTIAISRNMCRTSHGLQFLAVREDEMASAAMGVNTTRIKVIAFVIGSALAGAAGVLFGHMERFVTPDQFRMDLSFIVLTMVVLGGTGSITGSTLAAVVLFALPEYLRTVRDANGEPITLTAAWLVSGIFAVALAVWAIKKVGSSSQLAKPRRWGLIGLALVAAGVVQQLLTAVLANVPSLAARSWDLGQMRMVFFAGALVVVMLLRPEGVLGREEFSWDWVARKLRLRARGATA